LASGDNVFLYQGSQRLKFSRGKYLLTLAVPLKSQHTVEKVKGDQKLHVVLLGDSIFDNGVYVEGPPVIDQLKKQLSSWKELFSLKESKTTCTLLARDGNVLSNILSQVSKIPTDATHLFVSIGGNDALGCMYQLQSPATDMESALVMMAEIRDEFSEKYQKAISKVLDKKLPTAVCTIYNPCFLHKGSKRGFGMTEEKTQKACEIGLAVLNDVIIQTAVKFQLPVIELRGLFTDEADYANPIEPSEKGGAKMVAVMSEMLTLTSWKGCTIYPKL